MLYTLKVSQYLGSFLINQLFYVFLQFQGEVIPFRNYLHRYPTPYLASESSSPMWYAVRRASAHIIVLSSYSPFGNVVLQYLYLVLLELSVFSPCMLLSFRSFTFILVALNE